MHTTVAFFFFSIFNSNIIWTVEKKCQNISRLILEKRFGDSNDDDASGVCDNINGTDYQ